MKVGQIIFVSKDKKSYKGYSPSAFSKALLEYVKMREKETIIAG